MLYKEFLDRIGQPLDEQAERRRAERRKAKKKNPKMGAEANDSEDEEEEDPVLIAWEVEWWAKEGAAIIH